jgi:hypothetical protein
MVAGQLNLGTAKPTFRSNEDFDACAYTKVTPGESSPQGAPTFFVQFFPGNETNRTVP